MYCAPDCFHLNLFASNKIRLKSTGCYTINKNEIRHRRQETNQKI